MMFNEMPFLDRFDAAAKAGFTAVEFLFPYEHPPEEIADGCKRNGLTQALFNLPPGDWAAGERVRRAARTVRRMQRACSTALPYAKATGVKRLHLMAGIADRRDPQGGRGVPQVGRMDGGACAARHRSGARADQRARLPGYFLNDFDFAARPDRRTEAPEPEAAVRHLSLPDRAWRRDHGAARDDADDRPCPDRQRAVAQRARSARS